VLPSCYGQTRPLVVDSLRLIFISPFNSCLCILSILLFSPRLDSAGCRDDCHLLVLSVGGRDGVVLLANSTSNLSCLSILYQLLMLGMIRFPSQIIQSCEAHISMQSECEAHISMQAHIAMHQVRFHIISIIYFHFTCMVPYIVCPACVCDGTAQVTLGSFTLYTARYNSWPAVVILISLAHALHNKYIQPFLFVSICTVQQRPGFDSIYGITNANLFISFTCNCKSQFNC
jgi:hypothetical protein